MPNMLLRVRNLKTNFYTYAGVVQALEGVDFDMREGETLGLVGETGCGKSVTALSILRLIPQPPGKIEQGEVLFDVPEDKLAEIERLEAAVRALLPRILGEGPQSRPEDLSARTLNELWEAMRVRRSVSKGDLSAYRAVAYPLLELKSKYDLLTKTDAEMRAIRGNKIAIIFQDPMQSLNPVFPIGDQIGENILLHRRAEVVAGLAGKMEIEQDRDRLGRDLRRADPKGAAAPRPLPPSSPLPSPVVWAAALWILWGVVLAGLMGAIALAAVSLVAPSATGTLLAELTAREVLGIFVALGLLQLRSWARVTAIVVAGVELVVQILIFLATILTPAWAVGVVLFFGISLNVIVILQLTKQGVADAFVGRPTGWTALVQDAEADVGALVDLRDLVARSMLSEDLREPIQQRVDNLIRRVRSAFDARERITGHFQNVLPRRVQLGLFRHIRDHPRDPLVAFLAWLPLLRRVVVRPLEREAVNRAIQILRKVKISDPERIARQYPYELSGGMQQRALISIALSCNPRLLIADEPTTALDVTIQSQILDLIRDLKRELGSSVLLITHDLGIIAEMCNRVCVMYAGSIVEDADVRAVFKAPLHPYTQGLMRAIPSHTVRKDRLEIIRGSVPNLIYPPPGCRFHPRCPMVMPTCGWSPTEVGEHLRDAMLTLSAERPWPFDAEAVTWSMGGPGELRITFPEGVSMDVAVEAIRVAVESARSRPAVGSVLAVEPGNGGRGWELDPSGSDSAGGAPQAEGYPFVRVRILEARKPPSYHPEPNHAVACLLYAEGLAAVGGVPVGR